MEKKKSWYKSNGEESVIFVPYTPGGKLKKSYETEIRKSNFKIKVVEQSGTRITDVLHKKDPFKQDRCNKPDCFLCTTNGKGNCARENVNYRISCTEDCQNKDVYHGETGYNAYTRGEEHLQKYNKNNPEVNDGPTLQYRTRWKKSEVQDGRNRNVLP